MQTVNIFRHSYAENYETRVEIVDDAHSWDMRVSISPSEDGKTITQTQSDNIFDLNIALRVMEIYKGFFVYKRPLHIGAEPFERNFTNLTEEEAKDFFVSAGYSCSSTIAVENHELVIGIFSIFKDGKCKTNVILIREGIRLFVEKLYDFLDVHYIPCPEDSIYCDSTEEVSLFGINSVDVKIEIKQKSQTLEFSVPHLLSKYLAWQLVSINGGVVLFQFPKPIDKAELEEYPSLFGIKSYSVFGSDEQKTAFTDRLKEGCECVAHHYRVDSDFISKELFFEKENQEIQVRIMKEGVTFDLSGSLVVS